MPGPKPVNVTFQPPELHLRRGEGAPATLTVSGTADYDVPWLPFLAISAVEPGLTAQTTNVADDWEVQREITLHFTVSMDPQAEAQKSGVRFRCDLVGVGIGFGYNVYIEQSP